MYHGSKWSKDRRVAAFTVQIVRNKDIGEQDKDGYQEDLDRKQPHDDEHRSGDTPMIHVPLKTS